MGYKCDICGAADGVVYCLPDNAVMCKACDDRVHSANKLVKKHERVTLATTSEKPKCDVCQDAKALVFCAQDRSMMCRSCDLMVHSANEQVGRHQRHLITGVVLGLHQLPDVGTSGAVTSGMGAVPSLAQPSTTAAPAAAEARSTRSAARGKDAGGSARANGPAAPPARANGTADYADYDALRQLLGYPGGLPPGAPPPRAAKVGGSSGSSGGGGGNGAGVGSMPMNQAGHSHAAGASTSTGAGAGGSAFGMAHQSDGQMGGMGGGMGGGVGGPSPALLTAAELLGMPTLGDELSAKDIDAVCLPDTYTSLDDYDIDFSSLFEVPDLGPCSDSPKGDGFLFGSGLGDPSGMGGGMGNGGMAGMQRGGKEEAMDDGLVPDFFNAAPPQTNKRRRA